jgi:uncharacterized protein (DUF1778 family)
MKYFCRLVNCTHLHGKLALICTIYNRTLQRELRLAMMKQETHRTARVEARITPDVLALVRRAAELQGRSVSDFMVTAAQDAANRTIEETNIIRLSAEDQLRFYELLLNPPSSSPAMLKAFDRRRELLGIE